MINTNNLVTRLVEHKGQTALAAGMTVKVSGHKDTGTAGLSRALPTQTVDLAVVVNLVELEDGELDLPVLMLDLLGGGVILLLTLLTATSEIKGIVKILKDLLCHATYTKIIQLLSVNMQSNKFN